MFGGIQSQKGIWAGFRPPVRQHAISGYAYLFPPSGGETTAYLRTFSNLTLPIDLTDVSSSIERKPPNSSLFSIIRSAVLGPTPGRSISSSFDALFRSIGKPGSRGGGVCTDGCCAGRDALKLISPLVTGCPGGLPLKRGGCRKVMARKTNERAMNAPYLALSMLARS